MFILKLMSPVQTSPLGSIPKNYTVIHITFLLEYLMLLSNIQNGTRGQPLNSILSKDSPSEYLGIHSIAKVRNP